MPLTLLRPHYLVIRNRLKGKNRSPRAIRRDLLLLGISLIIMVCIYIVFFILFRGLAREPSFARIIPRKMIDLVYAYFLVLLAISSTVAAMSNIYSSETIQLLLQAPVSSFRIYTAKYLETFLETTFMFFILTTPAALAYVTQLGVSWWILPAGFCLSLLFLLIPVGFGIIIATTFAQLIALLWKRGGILFIGIFITFIGAAAQLAGDLRNVQEQKEGARAFVGMVGLNSTSNPAWLPSRWVADTLGVFVKGDPEGMMLKIGLLVSAVVLSFASGFLVFDLFSMRVRSSAHVHVTQGTGKFRGRSDIFRMVLEKVAGMIPFDAHARAIIVKDLSSLVRDRAQALQLILYLGLGALYITVYSFLSTALALSAVAQQLWVAFLAISNVLLVGFMTTTILTRLVYPSVSLEGRAFWIIQVTPIRVQEVVRAKLYCWLPFTTLLASSLMVVGAFAIGLDVATSMIVLLLGLAMTLGTTALAIGLGARYASFDWESPSQLAIGLGTLSLLLLSVTVVFLFTIPSSVLLSFLIVPRLREIVGAETSYFVMIISLWSIVFGGFVLMSRSISNGSRALEERLKEA